MQLASRARALASHLPGLLLVCQFLLLNSALNLINRYALGQYGLRFPLSLTCCHMVVCTLALLPLHLSQQPWAETRAGFARQWRGLVCIGTCLAGGVAVNNLSLVTMTLSLNQVIRSFIPVVTALICAGLDRRLPDRLEMVALLVLTTGVAISVWEGSVKGDSRGVLLCMMGTVCTGAMSSLSGKFLSESLGAMTLTLYTSPISALTIAPFLLAREWHYLMAYLASRPGPLLLVAGVSSAVAVAYNITHFHVIHRMSAVTSTVVGEVKIMLLLLASVYILGERQQFSPRFLAGCLMAFGGFCMYSHIKLGARQQSHAGQALLPAASKVLPAGKAAPHGRQLEFSGSFTIPLLKPGGPGLNVSEGEESAIKAAVASE